MFVFHVVPRSLFLVSKKINELATNSSNVAFSEHATERMEERNFTSKDVLEILKKGIITEAPIKREYGDFKYKVEMRDFRGGRHAAAVTVIHQKKDKKEKLIVVTTMWLD